MWWIVAALAQPLPCPAGTAPVDGLHPAPAGPTATVRLAPLWAAGVAVDPERARGAPVPARWCARSDGTRHGPARFELPEGPLTGAYDEGLPSGSWSEPTRRGTHDWSWSGSRRVRRAEVRGDVVGVYRFDADGALHGRFAVDAVRGRFDRGRPTGDWEVLRAQSWPGDVGGPARMHRLTHVDGELASATWVLRGGATAVTGTFADGRAHGAWSVPHAEVILQHGTGSVPVHTLDGAAIYVSELVDGVEVARPMFGDARVPGLDGTSADAALLGTTVGSVAVGTPEWCPAEGGARVTLTPSGSVPIVLDREACLTSGTSGSPGTPLRSETGDEVPPPTTGDRPPGRCDRYQVMVLMEAGYGAGITACTRDQPYPRTPVFRVHAWADADDAIRAMVDLLERLDIATPVELRVAPRKRVVPL